MTQMLQDYFGSTDCNIFRDSFNVFEEYTTVTVRTYPNQKPWITGNIRTELKTTAAAFKEQETNPVLLTYLMTSLSPWGNFVAVSCTLLKWRLNTGYLNATLRLKKLFFEPCGGPDLNDLIQACLFDSKYVACCCHDVGHLGRFMTPINTFPLFPLSTLPM